MIHTSILDQEALREKHISCGALPPDRCAFKRPLRKLHEQMKSTAMKSLAAALALYVLAGNLVAQVTETNLHSFGAFAGDGSYPQAALVRGTDGNFYGTAESGGTNNHGIVFRISPGGSYAILHSFLDSTNEGAGPKAALVQGTDGNFRGTTVGGGGSTGGGTVFRISASGDFTNLYSFIGSVSSDVGFQPLAGLVQASDGNFYGTAYSGGTNGAGTVFQIGPNGGYRLLHDFGSFTGDGRVPMAGLIQGSDGNLYGTTQLGGTADGTVFRITTNGVITILHNFTGYNDGSAPQAGLVWGNDGYFYGTTSEGGTNQLGSNGGTVFRMNPSSGDYTILHEFPAFTGDGESPDAALVLGSDGNFYGTTVSGGASGHGAVFRISPGGTYSNLYSFAGYPDGWEPGAGLVQGNDGSFYGTTYLGGTNKSSQGTGLGCVFKLTVPLNPPANQISGLQVAGTNVLISIPSVAGETYQLQYRTSLTSGTWSNVMDAPVTTLGGLLMVTNVGGFSQSEQFYRFKIEL